MVIYVAVAQRGTASSAASGRSRCQAARGTRSGRPSSATFVAHAPAIKQGGDAQHLAHAGAPGLAGSRSRRLADSGSPHGGFGSSSTRTCVPGRDALGLEAASATHRPGNRLPLSTARLPFEIASSNDVPPDHRAFAPASSSASVRRSRQARRRGGRSERSCSTRRAAHGHMSRQICPRRRSAISGVRGRPRPRRPDET
jgi:hypothetical protein